MIAAKMPSGASETRAIASRVAKILRDRGRNDEAIAILSSSAAAFGNDAEGQALLAEALRIDPNSSLARAAFERMEQVAGDHRNLDEAIGKYQHDDLAKLERALRPGVFLKAQVGFNNNIKYKGAEYHVQTEDSGLDKPHIITHLFADGGRVIRSHKRSYASDVSRTDVSTFVRTLMKGQHMEMVLTLREGKFDDIIAGRASGGMVVLEQPPKVDLDRMGKAAAERRTSPKGATPPARPSAPDSARSSAPQIARPIKVPAVPPANAPVRARLHVTRSLFGGPDFWDMRGDEAIIGSAGTIQLESERFCHPKEAMVTFDPNPSSGGSLILADLDGGNGVFVRIHRRVEIGLLDEFIVGDQLLRLERNPDPNDGPGPGPTYFRSSLKWPSAFRVVQVFEGGGVGAVSMARGTTLQIGSALDYANDMVFRGDPLVAPYHCVIEEQAEAFILSDLGAKSGVFVRVHGRHRLTHGSELLVGRTRLVVDMSPSDARFSALG
ncbi:MAG: FHA domain-containing protein [Polyangiaceae bacterium]|nr:FHA domain-containing protein [Polyangiaceae bacterium]